MADLRSRLHFGDLAGERIPSAIAVDRKARLPPPIAAANADSPSWPRWRHAGVRGRWSDRLHHYTSRREQRVRRPEQPRGLVRLPVVGGHGRQPRQAETLTPAIAKILHERQPLSETGRASMGVATESGHLTEIVKHQGHVL